MNSYKSETWITPEVDPREYAYFIPIVDWAETYITIKRWHSDGYDRVKATQFIKRENENGIFVDITTVNYIIEGSTGNIKLDASLIRMSNSSVTVRTLEPDNDLIYGTGLIGVKS